MTRPRPAGSGVYQGGSYSADDTGQITTTLPGPNSIPRQVPAKASPIATPIVPGRPVRRGTVYGGQTGQPTSANADAPLEQSGSLTGAILARGQSARFRPEPRRSRWRTVLTVTVSIAAFIGAIGVIAYVLAGDFLRALLHAIMHMA